jgi:hypothetical protein
VNQNGRAREGFVEDRAAPPPPPEQEVIPPERKEARPGVQRAAPPPEIAPSPVEQAPDAGAEEWPIKVKLLYKAIRNNRNEEIKEVSLREPRAGDINRYGNPVRVNQDGDVLIDERKMTYIIAALTDILPPFIETMDPRDWNSVAYRLRRFFLPDPAAW